MTNEIQEAKQRQYTVTFFKTTKMRPLERHRRKLVLCLDKHKTSFSGFRLTEFVIRHLESASRLCVHLH